MTAPRGGGADSSALARLGRVFDRIVDVGGVLAAVLLIGAMLLTTVKVVFRYVLNNSLIGADQLSGTLLLYIALLGGAWVLRRNEHVTIDLLLGYVSPRNRWLLMVASSLIGAAVCLLITVFGTLETIDSIQRGVRIPAEIEMPRAVELVVIPLGFLLMTIQFVRNAVDRIRSGEAAPQSSTISI